MIARCCTFLRANSATVTTDRGAYESCLADLTADGEVDSGDLNSFIGAFVAGSLVADVTGDGQVDSGDLQLFIDLFSIGC